MVLVKLQPYRQHYCFQEESEAKFKWEGFDESQATWEDKDAFEATYPSFNLEDKVVFKGGGIVMDENNVGSELEADNQRRNPEHVTNDPQDVGCRRSTCMKFTSSKLHGFEAEKGYK
ncbi:hypothetical protein D0Y65_012017 [Glycine soja]|uniref:Chromo domain-containing protein n=1 Tax=Glycine soja TaxID=3848 RepID=A0A445KMA0_GLYSO|nr:hypothetical protein D0Y65_012017 [Glycine soja]